VEIVTYIDVLGREYYYISTIAPQVPESADMARYSVNMQEKQAAGFFLEICIFVALLATLLAVAIPQVGRMVGKAEAGAQESEFHNIQTAVVEMLYDSPSGTLEPVGPTADMSKVRTSDSPPLVLTDYLHGPEAGLLQSGRSYIFTVDGTVIQVLP
jgi:type II secretory pathway pseudopilin PulG